MTTGHVFIATSLDGFIAREDGTITWLESFPTGDEDHGFEAFMASIDGLVMGRLTYETALTFPEWPYRKPVHVLSQTLGTGGVPPHLAGRVTISAETPPAIMARLAAVGWQRAYIDGGQVVRAFLNAGLIEDLVITRVPILLGAGRPLFGPLMHDIRLDHVGTTPFPSGLVQSTYRVVRPARTQGRR